MTKIGVNLMKDDPKSDKYSSTCFDSRKSNLTWCFNGSLYYSVHFLAFLAGCLLWDAHKGESLKKSWGWADSPLGHLGYEIDYVWLHLITCMVTLKKISWNEIFKFVSDLNIVLELQFILLSTISST